MCYDLDGYCYSVCLVFVVLLFVWVIAVVLMLVYVVYYWLIGG